MKELAALRRLVARQHGLVTRPQLAVLGWSRHDVSGHVRRGQLVIVRPGVYALVGALPSWAQAVHAVCLAGGGSTLASHLSAARLWGLRVPDRPGIHTVSPPGRRIRLEGVVAHRSEILPPADRARRHFIPVTSASRTLVDVSGPMGEAWSARVLDQLIRNHRLRLPDVRACVARLAGPGRRRLSNIRAVLVLRMPAYDPGDSNLEVRVLSCLASAGLPSPVQQHRVVVGGRRCYIDMAYPDVRLAIEVDGWEVHGLRFAFTDDRARANELVAHGWTVVRFTSDMADATIVSVVRRTLDRLTRSSGAA